MATNYANNSAQSGCNGVNEAVPQYYGTYLYIDLTSQVESMTDWVRLNRIDYLAGIQTSRVPTETYYTSVLVRDQAYVDYCGFDWAQSHSDPGFVGLVTCDQVVAAGSMSGQCSKHTMRFNLNWITGSTQNDRHGLACHEAGHTVGLKHSTFNDQESCMPTDYPKPRNGYSGHDGNHIVNNYT